MAPDPLKWSSGKIYYRSKLISTGKIPEICRGFAAGIKEALGEQCQALMLVIPQDVSDSYNEMSKNFRTMRTSQTSGVYRDIYEKGKQEGRSAVQSRKLEA